MKILFHGLGSIGTRHKRLIEQHFDHECLHFRRDGWVDADVAFICNPSFMHIETAIECARRGMHLFIEKPIDTKLDRLDELQAIVDEKGLTAYVAYPFRHHPNMVAAWSADGALHHVSCRTNYDSWKKAWWEHSGGIHMELSHEFDTIDHLTGGIKEILAVERRDGWHLYEIFDRFGRGTGLNLSYADQDAPTRRTLFFPNRAVILEVTDEMYLNQLHYFFGNINNPHLMNNLRDATRLFKMLLDINRSM